MEIDAMGKVLVSARIENLDDLYQLDRGAISPAEVRQVEVSDALVDTGATILSMPARLIRQLGLRPVRTRQARTTAGPMTVQIYGAVRLTIQGRDCLERRHRTPRRLPRPHRSNPSRTPRLRRRSDLAETHRQPRPRRRAHSGTLLNPLP